MSAIIIEVYFFSLQIHTFMGNSSNKGVALAIAARPKMHYKCREALYPRGDNVHRFTVPDDKVPWSVPFPAYSPPTFTSESVQNKPPWADPDLTWVRRVWIKGEGYITCPFWEGLSQYKGAICSVYKDSHYKGMTFNKWNTQGACQYKEAAFSADELWL